MKQLILALSLLSLTQMAFAQNIHILCEEYSVESGSESHSMSQAAEKLKLGTQLVKFEIVHPGKMQNCYENLTEVYSGGRTSMRLNNSKTNEFCVYDNGGIKDATYGWVCKR